MSIYLSFMYFMNETTLTAVCIDGLQQALCLMKVTTCICLSILEGCVSINSLGIDVFFCSTNYKHGWLCRHNTQIHTVRNTFLLVIDLTLPLERWHTNISTFFFLVSASLSPSRPCPSPKYYSPLSFTSLSFVQPFLRCCFFFPAQPSPFFSFRSLLASAPFPSIYLSPPSASSFPGPVNPSPHCLPLFHLSFTLHSPLSIYSSSLCFPDTSNLSSVVP